MSDMVDIFIPHMITSAFTNSVISTNLFDQSFVSPHQLDTLHTQDLAVHTSME